MEIRSKKCFNDNREGKSASGFFRKVALALRKIDVHFQGKGFLLQDVMLQPTIKTIGTYL